MLAYLDAVPLLKLILPIHSAPLRKSRPTFGESQSNITTQRLEQHSSMSRNERLAETESTNERH